MKNEFKFGDLVWIEASLGIKEGVYIFSGFDHYDPNSCILISYDFMMGQLTIPISIHIKSIRLLTETEKILYGKN